MTPQTQAQRRGEWPREAYTSESRQTTIKVEVAKYLLAMVVAGLTSYFAALYGIKEEIAVLKVRLEYMKEKVDAQTKAIDALTTSINTHTAAHHKGAP